MRNAPRALVVLLAFALPVAGGTAAPAFAQPAPAPPAPVLTLAQALARARTAAFEVRIARADAALASADAASSRAALRPQLALSANALDANLPQLGMPVARQAYGAASLSVPISAPGSALGARAADLTALAARSGASAAANDAAFDAARAYRRIQLADAVLAARTAAVEGQQSHLRVTAQRVAAGKSARYLLARDRAALANAQQAREDAAAERDQAANDLAALLDLGSGALAVEALDRTPLSDTREAAAARALRQRPSLQAAEQRLTAAQTALAGARAAYRPSLAFSAQSYQGTSSPDLGRSGGQLELTASLPLADGGARGAAAAKARADYERTAAMRDQARAAVVRDVANAWREYEAAARNTTTAEAALADAQEQLRIARLREAAGKAIATEVLDALALAAAARETVARSVARYDVAVAAIHHAAGDVTP